jgi:hypothetical protein
MWGIAHPGCGVGLWDGNDAPGSDEWNHLLQDRFGVSDIEEESACVREVKRPAG